MALLRNSQILPRVTINAFPVETLLEIFDFCRAAAMQCQSGGWPRTWRRLIHVCQRWRYVVLSSPLRLDLYLDCSNTSPVREMLDVWPPFPIQVTSSYLGDNIIAALEHRDRVTQIRLSLTCLQCEKLATVIQEPLPALTSLDLAWRSGPINEDDGFMQALPATFLGGSAPRLQSLSLSSFPFPTLPQLLLSCNDLTKLSLHDICDLGYISPEAMVTGLSALTRLTYLCIEFDGTFLHEIIQRPPLLTRGVTTVLPSLKEFHFEGFREYLEDFLARIDVPQLEIFRVMAFRQDVFDIRHVISHSRTLGSFNRAVVIFDLFSVVIQLYHPIKRIELGIQANAGRGWQVTSMTQIGTQSLDLLSSITELDILCDLVSNRSDILMDSTKWLDLFPLFSAVRTLRLSGAEADMLQDLTRESIAEVLPNLQAVYFRLYPEGEFEEVPLGLFFPPSGESATPVSMMTGTERASFYSPSWL